MSIFDIRTLGETAQFRIKYTIGSQIKLRFSEECWEIDDFNPVQTYKVRIKNWRIGFGTSILMVDIRDIEELWENHTSLLTNSTDVVSSEHGKVV